jgi:hypothetical protein
VTVTDGNGCEGIDEVDVIGSSATSSANNVDGINVYPNPASDWIMVDLGEIEKGPAKVSLVDVCGQLIWSEKKERVLIRIPVSQFDAGVYFLRIEMGMGVYGKKVVIQ